MKKRILSLLMACVMLALTVSAVLPTVAADGVPANLYTDTFNSETDVEYSGNTQIMPNATDIPFLFTWFDAAGEPVPARNVLTDDCYATYNKVLIDAGVFSPDEPFSDILAKYRAHLETYGKLTFKGNWQMVMMRYDGRHAGTMQKLSRTFLSSYGNIHGVIQKNGLPTTNECWDQFDVWPEEVQASLMKTLFETFGSLYVDPGSDGKLMFSEIKNIYANTVIAAYQAHNATTGSGGNTSQEYETGKSGILFAYPNKTSATANLYTVPENVVGEAFMSIDTITRTKFDAYTNDGKICMLHNGQIVWPADADFTNKTTWFDLKLSTAEDHGLAALNEALADVKMNVKTGDQIALCVTRVDGAIAVNLVPTMNVDKECIITFVDRSGNRICVDGGKVGTPFPKAPYAADEAGYEIDGTAAAELPATITGDMTVKYLGDPVITDAEIARVDIDAAADFALNLFLTPDPYATKVGVLGEDDEVIWGEKQADGTFLVTVPNLAAKDMDEEKIIIPVQEFNDAGGRNYDGAELAVVPTEVLSEYADRDVSDAEKAVAAAALDYVAAAKAYFYGEALEADVAARLAEQDAAIATLESNVSLSDKDEYAVTGVTLVLRGQLMFKVRVALSEMNFIDEEALDYVIAVEHDGSESEYEGFVYTEGDEELSMVMTVCGVAASDFADTFKFTVKDGSFAVSQTFSYSVNDYIARTFDANAPEADLLRAIYALGAAANVA